MKEMITEQRTVEERERAKRQGILSSTRKDDCTVGTYAPFWILKCVNTKYHKVICVLPAPIVIFSSCFDDCLAELEGLIKAITR